ncbi:MAG: hypothetical protein ACREU6_16995 [Steroidobacteraceae bacterium]
MDPDENGSAEAPAAVKESADGEHFLVLTEIGDLARGVNRYDLMIYDTNKVLAAVNDSSLSLPRAHLVAEFATESEHPAIEDVGWAGKGLLAFIGRKGNAAAQVFSVDIVTDKLTQLTHAEDDVLTFGWSMEHGKLVYGARNSPNWSVRNRLGYVVYSTDINTMLSLNSRDVPDVWLPTVKYSVLNLGTGMAREIPGAEGTYPGKISLSPGGRWAVVPLRVIVPPTQWQRYEFLRKYRHEYEELLRRGSLAAGENSRLIDMLGGENPENPAITDKIQHEKLCQYFLVDTDAVKVRPLLDAPSDGCELSLPPARWSSDGSKVTVAHTHLPLQVAADGGARQQQEVSDVEVSIGSNTIKVLPQSTEDGNRSSFHQNRPGLYAWVSQELNKPPQLVARDIKTGAERQITSFNPQLASISLGSARYFDFTDRMGRRFEGGLILPDGFVWGRRYPIVIQTHGFSRGAFLVDGPHGVTTAFSARALVGRGMAVLQIDETWPIAGPGAGSRTPPTRMYDSENAAFDAALGAAIEALERAGIADPNRIGVIGWSRTAMYVNYFLAFSGYPIAAATIADGTSATPLCYAVRYGASYPGGGMYEFEDEDLKGIGAPLWGAGISRWLERSYFFHLDKIRTPMRFEHLGVGIPCDWDEFVIEERMNRPVEMIHIPNAAHNILNPVSRYTSQEGNVDWFDFWLNGHEDQSPAKIGQYQRWRKLRVERDRIRESSPAAAPAR